VHVGKRTATLIKNGDSIPLSPERRQGLDKFESILDLIPQHIESIPERGTKPPKFRVSDFTFRRESPRLKSELDRAYQSLTSTKLLAPRNECALEIANIGTRVAGAICEIPVLNLLKPAVGMAALICDTAKTVNGNRDAALALARHAEDVTTSIVERANIVSHGEGVADSLMALRLTLEDVQAFLELVQSRRRVTSWILTGKDEDRFTELNRALDRALAVFSSSQIIETSAIVHRNTQGLTALVATVYRVEDELKRTMPRVFRWGKNTAFVPFSSHQSPISLFFIDLRKTGVH